MRPSRFHDSCLPPGRFAAWWMSCALGLVAGCADWPLSSKWAMSDPDYSAKYSRPYGSDKPLRILKQAADARFQEGKSGPSFGAAWSSSPATAGAELAGTHYATSWLETRLGFMGMLGTSDPDWFLGMNTGLRVQTPTRLSPYAGLGGFAGGNSHKSPADNDGEDNDSDGSIDEADETDRDFEFLGAVYPEVGLHYWLSHRTRLSGGARYFITTDGRDSDFWFYGLEFSFFERDRKPEKEETQPTGPDTP